MDHTATLVDCTDAPLQVGLWMSVNEEGWSGKVDVPDGKYAIAVSCGQYFLTVDAHGALGGDEPELVASAIASVKKNGDLIAAAATYIVFLIQQSQEMRQSLEGISEATKKLGHILGSKT